MSSFGHSTPSLGRGLTLSFLATFFAAGYLIPYRYAVDGSSHFAAMGAMFLFAILFNGGLALAQFQKKALHFDREAVSTAVALAACTIVGNLGIALALPDIGTGMTSVLLKAQVILTPWMAWWALDEHASPRLWVGAVLAMLGVALPQLIEGSHQGDIGYAWALIAAVAFASMQIITRRVIVRIQAASVNTLRLVMALLALQLLPEGRGMWTLSPSVWLAAAAAGLLGPGLSRICLMAALEHMSPSLTALVALIGPILAFGLGYLAYGETPGGLEMSGAVLILVGVFWAMLPSLRDVFGFSPNPSRREAQSG